MSSWAARIADTLIELREDGVDDFDEAFDLALKRWPFAGRDAGDAIQPLFDERGRGTTGENDGLVPFTRRVMRDAWTGEFGPPGSGRGPAIFHFRPEMTLLAVDESAPAVRAAGANGRVRQAA